MRREIIEEDGMLQVVLIDNAPMEKGGPGSGNFGHSGIIGQRGGSGGGGRLAGGGGKPAAYSDFSVGSTGLHGGEITSADETTIDSVNGDMVRAKVSYGSGTMSISTIEGSMPKPGDTVKLIREQKEKSTWNYVVSQDYKAK